MRGTEEDVATEKTLCRNQKELEITIIEMEEIVLHKEICRTKALEVCSGSSGLCREGVPLDTCT